MFKDIEIRYALQITLLGNITNSVLAIAYEYDSKEKKIVIDFFVAHEFNCEEEYLREIETEFLSFFNDQEFNDCKLRCQKNYNFQLLNNIENLVFLKKIG